MEHFIFHICLPFLIGCAIGIVITKLIFKFIPKVVWFFSFKDRKAYISVMQAKPRVLYKIINDDETSVKYKFEGCGYSAMLWFCHEDGTRHIGIFDEKIHECLFSGTTFKDKEECLFNHLMNDTENESEEHFETIKHGNATYMLYDGYEKELPNMQED